MAPLQSKEAGDGRLYYLDNFRTYLTVLVIYHHTAVAYGGKGGWFYQSKFHPEASSAMLICFNVLNHTYFMASFFFLSGLMSSKALKRKSKLEFLQTKYIRLGIPVVIYTLFAGPAQIALSKLHRHEHLGLDILIEYWESLRGVSGPVWYTALLLIFDTIYALVPDSVSFPTPPFLIGMILDVAGNFGMQLLYPAGYKLVPLNLNLGYLVQYIASYLLGIRFATFDPLSTQPLLSVSPTGTTLLASSIISYFSLTGLLHYYPGEYLRSSALGGLNLVVLSYAVVLQETGGYLLGSAILTRFQRSSLFNRSWGSVGRYSYAAFLVHPIVCVGAQLWTDDWNANGVLKTVVIGTIGALGSWSVGWALLKIPDVNRVLV
jgi:hypothetical protein